MGAPRWGNRSITSAHEQALVFCADFAAVCRQQGDLLDYFRWKCVLNENRLAVRSTLSTLRKSNGQAQLPLM